LLIYSTKLDRKMPEWLGTPHGVVTEKQAEKLGPGRAEATLETAESQVTERVTETVQI
jgi:hypothetical protein